MYCHTSSTTHLYVSRHNIGDLEESQRVFISVEQLVELHLFKSVLVPMVLLHDMGRASWTMLPLGPLNEYR